MKEVESLAAENKSLKESLKILESSLVNFIEKFETLREGFYDHETKLNNQLAQLERKVEDKLQIYSTELKDDLKKELTNTRQLIRDKINGFDKKLNTLEHGLEDNLKEEGVAQAEAVEIDNSMIRDDLNNLQSKMNDIEDHLDKVTTMSHSSMETSEQALEIQKIQGTKLVDLGKKIKCLEEKVDNPKPDLYLSEKEGMDLPSKVDHHAVTKDKASSQSSNQHVRDSYAEVVRHNPPENHSNRNISWDKRMSTNSRSVIVLMDSNRQHIDRERLWRGSQIVPCNTLSSVLPIIESLAVIPSAVLIHTGVNDIETMSAESLFEHFEHVINSFHKTLPNTKLIISEVTPRMDAFDRDVVQVNDLIKSFTYDMENITIVKHHSLRNLQLMRDNKHVSSSAGVLRLAGNLKFGIRSAFGIPTMKESQFSRQNEFAPAPTRMGMPNIWSSPNSSTQRTIEMFPTKLSDRNMPSTQHQMAKPPEVLAKAKGRQDQLDTLIALLLKKYQMPDEV